MKTITFINVKGGVGKTSSSVTVAHILATLYNKKVLLIDLDPQSNATDFYNLYDSEYTVEHLLSGRGIDSTGKEIAITAKDVIKSSGYDNLDVIPANLTLGRTEKQLVADVSTPQQFRLKSALAEYDNQYDYCIIDCSPTAESLVNTNGLAMSDLVFVPLKCDKWATRGLNATISVINTISSYNFNLKFGGSFFVQWENRNINKTVYEILKDELKDKMLDIKIRKNKSVEEMTYACEPLLIYDKEGKATDDYIELTKHIMSVIQ